MTHNLIAYTNFAKINGQEWAHLRDRKFLIYTLVGVAVFKTQITLQGINQGH